MNPLLVAMTPLQSWTLLILIALGVMAFLQILMSMEAHIHGPRPAETDGRQQQVDEASAFTIHAGRAEPYNHEIHGL